MVINNEDNIVLNHHQLMLLTREYEKYDKEASLNFFRKINEQFEITNYQYLQQDMIFVEKKEYDEIVKIIKIDILNLKDDNEQIEQVKLEERIINDVLAIIYTAKGTFDISDDEMEQTINSMQSLTDYEREIAKRMFLKDQSKKR